MNNFTVETRGRCFLCLNKIKIQSEPVSPSPSQPLHYLSRYLKMDMRKVFDEEGVVTPDLLAKVQKARLKVELCEECVCLNETFSKLYRQLEKIEMEVVSCVNIIHRKLSAAKTDLAIQIDNAGGILHGKRKIAEALRNEAKQKCFHKLSTADAPRLKMRKLSMKQVDDKMRKIKSKYLHQQQIMTTGNNPSSYQNPDLAEEIVKEEPLISDPSEDNDTRNDYFEDHDFDDEESVGKLVSSSSTASPIKAYTGEDNSEIKAGINPNDAVPSPKFQIEDGKFKCELCSREFNTKHGWKVHYESIHLKIRYKCNLCEKEFNDKSVYRRHHQSIHLGVKFKCLVCNKMFSLKQDLTRHQRAGSCITGTLPNRNT